MVPPETMCVIGTIDPTDISVFYSAEKDDCYGWKLSGRYVDPFTFLLERKRN